VTPGLFDEILARGGARESVDDTAWLAALLDVEAALARATADAGGLDPDTAEAIATACRPEGFDVAALARRLDLDEPPLPWHTERGRVAELAGVLGRAGAAIGSVATDLVLLAQTEVGEVREDVPGRGGSSTLPHKRNPVAAISARAAAIAVPGLVASLLTAASGHEYERAAGSWHAEWRPTSELLRTVGSGAAWLADALGHLALDPARVAASLDVTGGLLLAENVTTTLRGRVDDPKGLVTAAASASLDEDRPFADVLAEALAGTDVTRAEIDAALDPAAHVGEAVDLVDAFLAARATPEEYP
jgi:3-carboxy-cis,cis-muconate cycloisomerase